MDEVDYLSLKRGIDVPGVAINAIIAGCSARGGFREAAHTAGDAWSWHHDLQDGLVMQAGRDPQAAKAICTGMERGWLLRTGEVVSTIISVIRAAPDHPVSQAYRDHLTPAMLRREPWGVRVANAILLGCQPTVGDPMEPLRQVAAQVSTASAM